MRRDYTFPELDVRNLHVKYPVILVHGMACRDRNLKDRQTAWGEIPNILKERGIQVFYGMSDAWGTIAHNASMLKDTVEEVLTATGSEKVNLIAHSKGGLEARYMITKLGMDDKVASLTTVDTPHHGVVIADKIYKILPQKLIRKISSIVDKRAKRLGDLEPDTYTVGTELSMAQCEEFNKNVTNSDKVFYQSVSCVSHPVWTPKYAFTSLWLRLNGYANSDGIVPGSSSEWGECMKVAGYDHDNLRGQCTNNTQRHMLMFLYLNLLIVLASKGL